MEKIRVLEGGKTPNIAADAVRQMIADSAVLVEYVILTAKLQRAKFVALKQEGFDDSQALELCKKVFL
jgi:hypothetical protein